jgi:hypothetical protein
MIQYVDINLWKSIRIRTGITFNQSYSYFIPEINMLYTEKNYLVVISITICFSSKIFVY